MISVKELGSWAMVLPVEDAGMLERVGFWDCELRSWRHAAAYMMMMMMMMVSSWCRVVRTIDVVHGISGFSSLFAAFYSTVEFWVKGLVSEDDGFNWGSVMWT